MVMNPRHTKWKARLQEVLGNCRPVHPDSFFAQSWPKAETLLQPQFLRVYVLGLLLIEMREKQIDWSQGKPVLILGLDIILLAWMCILQKLGIDPKEEKKNHPGDNELICINPLLSVFVLWYIIGLPRMRNVILDYLPVLSDKPTSCR